LFVKARSSRQNNENESLSAGGKRPLVAKQHEKFCRASTTASDSPWHWRAWSSWGKGDRRNQVPIAAVDPTGDIEI